MAFPLDSTDKNSARNRVAPNSKKERRERSTAMILPLTSPVVEHLAVANAASVENIRAVAEAAEHVPAYIPLLALSVIVTLGLALWAFGGRFVKPSVILLTSAGGGYAGFTLGEAMDPAIGPWIGLAGGIFLGCVIGIWLFRMAAGFLLAAFLAVAAPTAAAVAFDYDLAERAQAIVEVVRDAATGDHDDAETDDTSETVEPRSITEDDNLATTDEPVTARGVLARAGAWFTGFASDAAEGGEEIWDDLEPGEQRTIVATGLVGAIAGFVIGTLFSTIAMAVLTAGLGAAAVLGAGSRLAILSRPELESSFPDSPIAWAAIWVSVAFLGAILQIAPHRKRKKRRQPAQTESE